jgi:hypothetical protein
MLIGMVLTALVAGGCSSDDESGKDAANGRGGKDGLISAEFEAVDGMDLSAEVEPITAEEAAYITRAEMKAIQACMEAQGFEYPLEDELASVVIPSDYLSPDQLRRSGYQIDLEALATPESGTSQSQEELFATMSDEEQAAWQEALFAEDSPEIGLADDTGGVLSESTGGCVGEGRAEVYGSVPNHLRYDRALQMFQTDLGASLSQMEEYQVPLDAWQACMRAAGHEVDEADDYGLPYVLRRGSASLSGGPSVTEDVVREISLADADCQESSGIHTVREGLLSDARDAIADELSIDYTQYAAFQHAVLERAKRLGY